MNAPTADPERLQRLNVLAAEHLAGWKRYRFLDSVMLIGPEEPFNSVFFKPTDEPVTSPCSTIPNYAHSLDACATLEAIVVSRGHGSRYAAELQRWAEQQEAGTRMLAFATAPAWVRLEACLRVCGVEVQE